MSLLVEAAQTGCESGVSKLLGRAAAAVAVVAEHKGPNNRVGLHTAEHCSPIRTGCTPFRLVVLLVKDDAAALMSRWKSKW